VIAQLLKCTDIVVDQAMTNCNATPLILAAAEGHHQCAELLIDAGADPAVSMTAAETDIGGGAGMRTIDLAKEKGHAAVVDHNTSSLDTERQVPTPSG
jgi:ankyrin repeat protein